MTAIVKNYLTLYPSNNNYTMSEFDLKTLCFEGFKEKSWGFGLKRVGIKIQNTITDKISFSGFGYKTQEGVCSIGVRMWLDHRDYSKFVVYDDRFPINQHFIEIIKQFQQQYPNLC
jgi:hypothetical protein